MLLEGVALPGLFTADIAVVISGKRKIDPFQVTMKTVILKSVK